ncbi:MAG: hypothetical protein LBD23_09685 [Oscillospiraceae bacterium]|jgi:hypothetical protein|nr:hypothetical protein [Oscillospiraceae bacterium]
MSQSQENFEMINHIKNKYSNKLLILNIVTLGISALGIVFNVITEKQIKVLPLHVITGMGALHLLVREILERIDNSKTNDIKGGKFR